MAKSPAPFNKGDHLPENGEYVCVPCGYHRVLKAGEVFPECISCMSGTAEGQHEDYIEGMEMWEKVVPVVPPPSSPLPLHSSKLK